MEQVKEECRDARGTLWLDSTLQDIRFALRTMRKNAALTVTVIGTLALGIGVNTAIFSVVNGVLLRGLPYAQPNRLVTLFETIPQWPRASAAYLNYLDWRRLNNTCADLAALRWSDLCDTREIGASGLYAVLRTKSDPASLRDAVRAEIRNADPDYIVSNIRPMDEIVTGTLASRRVLLTLLGTFAGIALLLAAVGIYGVISYSVSQRTREIGIRMAIGADRRGVLRMVLREGLALGSIGAGVGLILSFFACRALSAGLWILAGRLNYAMLPAVAIPLLLVTLLAAYIPARRASLIDPMRALRDE